MNDVFTDSSESEEGIIEERVYTSEHKEDSMHPELPKWDLSSVSGSEVSLEDFNFSDFNDDEGSKCPVADPIHPFSSISKEESVAAVVQLSLAHNLTKAATADIVKLIACHVPHGADYPSSFYRLKKEASLEQNWTKRHYFCVQCQEILDCYDRCQICNTIYTRKKLKKLGHYFIVMDLRKQFLTLLENSQIKGLIISSAHNLSLDTDYNSIKSGFDYMKLSKSPYDLTCTFNIDGVPVFNSSNSSLWPVQISINELPFRVRKKNILLAGIWFGQSKPNMKLFLPAVIDEMNSLSKVPLIWSSHEGIRIVNLSRHQKSSALADLLWLEHIGRHQNGEPGYFWSQ
ncbi:hypothetical protein Fcan01_20058 [Folsomia candida]|uniref:Uncharacterized protein n=1 Tax=Folsomia candida TaxID=158441 RepID=A0A226DJ51_FOLCA|nr:hypothetical protein Fcan01_20058 [Folsomia candida]